MKTRFYLPVITLLLIAILGLGSTIGQSEAATRTVEHVLGTTEIPTSPQRVVVLDAYGTLQTALDLGVPVVGAPTFPAGQPFAVFLSDEQTANIQSIGWFNDIDFEQIVALRPDLIIGWVNWGEPIYELLREIAPTVAAPVSFRADWREALRFSTEVFGKEDVFEAQLAAYEARLEAFRHGAADALESTRCRSFAQATTPYVSTRHITTTARCSPRRASADPLMRPWMIPQSITLMLRQNVSA